MEKECEMRIPESCAKCLYDKQAGKIQDEEYLRRVRELLDKRKPSDSAPYMVYLFNRQYEEMFGKPAGYADVKREYNDLVLGLEEEIRANIERSPDPLAAALQYARIGNYIDFGAMNHVEKDEFLSLFDKAGMSEKDEAVYRVFVSRCEKAESFLLIADNCGEIVLDKLFLEQLKKRFPRLEVKVLVRGGEVLNDATVEDAGYAGIDGIAEIIDSGISLAGTVHDMLPEEARRYLDSADVVLAKGQGNYETMHGIDRPVFYSFLCKCDLFVNRFGVPRLTGVFVEE